MKNGKKLILILSLGVALLPWIGVAGEEKPAAAGAAKEGSKDALPNPKDRVSYAVGMTFGNQIKRAGFEVDVDMVAAAIKDVLAGHELKINETQAREAIGSYQKEVQAKRDEERKKTAEKNKKEGETFLAENKKKEGIKTQDVKMPDGTTAEFQYKVITEGTGPIPKSNDIVTVNYKGTLLNGTEFDSSTKHGQPGKFTVNRLVRGWTEALEMMKVGSKWQLFLPSTLGYGDFGAGPNSPIEPGAALVFELELLSIEAPPQPAATQPLTSDIIRVPSADELKKGAKIEVLKPEEAARRAAEASTNKPEEKK